MNLRFGLRMLAKNPGFTVVAVLTLALGIGANAAIFSIVNAVLLHPLPYKNAARLVSISGRSVATGQTGAGVSYTKFLQLQQPVGAYYPLTLSFSVHGEPQQVTGIRASAGLLEVLGIQPAQGRSFSKDEDSEGGRDVAVITNGFWRNRLGADPAVLGKPISLDGN